MAAQSAFISFYEDWLFKQECLLRRLEALLSPEDGFDRNRECSEAIPIVFSHYHELFREKARVAAEDVFLALSPPWLSSFEQSLLWVTSFRPSMLFPIVDGSVAVEKLSPEQRQRMEAVKAETRRREKEITEGMARVQETVAETPVYDLMRRFGKLVDGEVTELDAAMEDLKAALLAVVGSADELRGWAATEVVGILSPVDGVRVLAAVARFQLQAKNWGRRKDSAREANAISAVDV